MSSRPLCRCGKRKATTLLHARGVGSGPLCLPCADEIMYALSLTVPEDEGREGYARWRADANALAAQSGEDPLPDREDRHA